MTAIGTLFIMKFMEEQCSQRPLRKNELHRLRVRSRFSIPEAAFLVGVTARCWHYWESGQRRISPAMSNLIRMTLSAAKGGQESGQPGETVSPGL